jgi:hypothetical protein
MVLRDSPHKGTSTLRLARDLAAAAQDGDALRGEWMKVMDALGRNREETRTAALR